MLGTIIGAVAPAVLGALTKKDGERGSGQQEPFFDPHEIVERVARMSPAITPGVEHPIAGAPDSPGYARIVQDELMARSLANVGGTEKLAELFFRDPAFNAYSESNFA